MGKVVYELFLVLGGAVGKLYMSCFWCLVVLWGSCIGVVSGAWCAAGKLYRGCFWCLVCYGEVV